MMCQLERQNICLQSKISVPCLWKTSYHISINQLSIHVVIWALMNMVWTWSLSHGKLWHEKSVQGVLDFVTCHWSLFWQTVVYMYMAIMEVIKSWWSNQIHLDLITWIALQPKYQAAPAKAGMEITKKFYMSFGQALKIFTCPKSFEHVRSKNNYFFLYFS